ERLVKGWNFVGHNDDARDDHAHGTHVAGTVAQSTGNGKGVAGMAPAARLMPVKVLSAFGSGTSHDIAEGIRWAVNHGARVINLSLGGGARSLAMESAVAYARRRGAVVICAAGNSGSRGVSYPAAYPGAFAVSAVGPQGRLAPYSSFGPQIAIAAPGGDKSQGEESGVLQQTLAEGSTREAAYRWFQGTSMATPHVAGAAALVMSLGVSAPGRALWRCSLQCSASGSPCFRSSRCRPPPGPSVSSRRGPATWAGARSCPSRSLCRRGSRRGRSRPRSARRWRGSPSAGRGRCCTRRSGGRSRCPTCLRW